jgi:DNA mismatch repair protein MutL
LNDYMAKVLSKCSSIKSGIKLENKEQESLVHDLFACKDPNISPFKKMIFKVIPIESINKMFFK